MMVKCYEENQEKEYRVIVGGTTCYFNSFIETYLKYHTIHPFKVHN